MNRSRIIFLASTLGFFDLCAEDLVVGQTYEMEKTFYQLQNVDDNTTNHVAVKNSKFIVRHSTEEGYAIQFVKIYSTEQVLRNDDLVAYDKMYLLPRKIGDSIPTSSVMIESTSGLSAGPLVVPFKYRFDDNSITGDATIGLYAGMTFEINLWESADWHFNMTPLVSAGLSQVSVENGGEVESKTSLTWAAGLLITHWSDINIGIVYGQDRIGDEYDWKHEGEGWISFMVGWQL